VEKEESGNKYELTNEATVKYLGLTPTPQEQKDEFNAIINNLMLSLEATIDDDDSVYHLLPDYDREKN
jgi:hypothetical protein